MSAQQGVTRFFHFFLVLKEKESAMYFEEETPFAIWVVIGILVILLLAASGTIAYLAIARKSKDNIRCDDSDGVKVGVNGECVAKIKACGNDTTLKDGICEADDGKGSKKLGAGAVTGIAIGGVVGAGVLAAVVSRAAWPDGAVAAFGNSMFDAGSRAASSMYETARASVGRLRRSHVAPEYEELEETDDDEGASEY